MEKYALIGHPLGHSMSPFIHKQLFESKLREFEYTLTDIHPDNLKSEFKFLKTLKGFNVTIPHKVSIIECLDRLDESAKRYNSVNCVINENGILIGYNTDCDGFLRSVDCNALCGKVLLLGCGGVGRMMAIESAMRGAELTIAIIPEAAKAAGILTDEIKAKIPGASVNTILIDNIKGCFDLLINATPVGMYPNCNQCPVSEEIIAGCSNIFDAVYNPTKTKLIELAHSHGINCTGGMSMLVYQAVRAHEIWNDDTYTKEQTDAVILKATEIVDNDF